MKRSDCQVNRKRAKSRFAVLPVSSEYYAVLNWRIWRICCLLVFVLPFGANAGGSGLNVVVAVNGNSTNSLDVGNYYCELRQVPPQNVLRINWPGPNTEWTLTEFNTYLRDPLHAMLVDRGLTNQVDFLVLSMDIPYRVIQDGTINSTTSVLFYGFKPNGSPPAQGLPASCSLPTWTVNGYAGSETPFRAMPPGSTSWTNVMATMITGFNVNDARFVISQGASSDSSFAAIESYLAKSSDYSRNIRFTSFDDAIFDTRVLGNYNLVKTNVTSPVGLGPMLGFQTGGYQFPVAGSVFVPGAMADNLTSYGGVLFQYTGGHVNILSFLAAGASGTYGTVDEPCGYVEKFPTPHNFFYQARGFALAECYYQSVTNPYQGLVMGEPLAAPFGLPANAAWNDLHSGAILRGTTNIGVTLSAANANLPVQQADLFVDGLYHSTITNIAPARSNLLTVTLNGRTMNYLVPLNATIKSVTTGLATLLNSPANSNATKVIAYPHGDRLELQSMDRTRPAEQVSLAVSSSAGSGTWQSTHLYAPRSSFLESPAEGVRGFSVSGSPATGSYLQFRVTKTNGAIITVGVTNPTGGLSLSNMATALLEAVDTSPELQSGDGLIAEDLLIFNGGSKAEFTLRARASGWNAARIQADLNGSGLTLSPAFAVTLEENLSDLRPRNHLYVRAGRQTLPLTFSLNSVALADGHHELTVVAYEGSHVRMQRRFSQKVLVQNSSLSATLGLVSGAANTLVGFPLQFSVVANTPAIAKVDLFSTGGLLATSTGQPTALFTVPSAQLGPGLHPFYAIITRSDGKQYRTETQEVRLLLPQSTDPSLRADIAGSPIVLSWPATAGRSYEVLSTTNLSSGFQVRATVSPTSSPATWAEPLPGVTQRFYRLRASN